MPEKIIIASQSNQKEGVYNPINMYEPEESAFHTRGFNQASGDDESIYVTNIPVPEDYILYLTEVLGLSLPQVIEVSDEENLSATVIESSNQLTHLNRGNTLTVFTPTEQEIKLFDHLNRLGVIEGATFTRGNVGLTNKVAQQLFLEDLEIEGQKLRQNASFVLAGEKSAESLIASLCEFSGGQSIFVKAPFGTGGEGTWKLSIEDLEQEIDLDKLSKIESYKHEEFENLSKLEKIVFLNTQFNTPLVLEKALEGNDILEHALHMYIDHEIGEVYHRGNFDQIAVDNAHEGCIYPSQNQFADRVLNYMFGKLGEELKLFGVVGDLAIDLLIDFGDKNSNQLKDLSDEELWKSVNVHIMEINPRTGANQYAKVFVEKVFGEDNQKIFQLMASQSFNCKSLSGLMGTVPGLSKLISDKKVLVSNYGRFQFGKFDLIVTGDTLTEVEQIVKIINSLQNNHEA